MSVEVFLTGLWEMWDGPVSGPCTHLLLGRMLQKLCDLHLVLLQPPLHQLGAVHIDRLQDVGGVIIHEGPAVDQEHAVQTPLQQSHEPFGPDESHRGQSSCPGMLCRIHDPSLSVCQTGTSSLPVVRWRGPWGPSAEERPHCGGSRWCHPVSVWLLSLKKKTVKKWKQGKWGFLHVPAGE